MNKTFDESKTFGYRIDALITDNDLTAKQVADAIGVTEQTISNWRRSDCGKKSDECEYIAPEIKCSLLVKLADYFHVSTDYLLGLSDNPAAKTGAESVAAYIHWSEDSVNKLHSNPIPARYVECLVQRTPFFDQIYESVPHFNSDLISWGWITLMGSTDE